MQTTTTRNRTAVAPVNGGNIQVLETLHTTHDGATSSPRSIYDLQSGSLSLPSVETDDVVTPDYQAKRNKGEVIMNDYQSEKHTYAGFNTRWSSKQEAIIDYGWSVYTYMAQTTMDPLQLGTNSQQYLTVADWSLIESDIDAIYDLQSAKLYSKLSEANMLALTTAYEFKKSIATINRSYRALWTLLRNMKNTKKLLSKGAITVAHAADVYLEVRYGLRPIFYDVRNAMEALASVNGKIRTRVHSSMPSVTKQETIPSVDFGGLNFTCLCSVEREHEQSYSAGAIIEPRFEFGDFNDCFGTNDIVASAWEIVPYSFILDWFVNVGDYLVALTPKYDVEILGTWFKTHDRKTTKATPYKLAYTKGKYSSTTSKILQAHPVRHTVEKTARYVNRGKPSLPRLNIRLDGLKILDILAIIRSNVKHLRV